MTANLVGIDFNMVLQLINTLVLFLLLRHFLFRPVSGFMASRRERIRHSIASAREKEEQARRLKEEYEARLGDIREEAQRIMRDAVARAEEQRQEIIREAKRERERILAGARRDINLEKEKAMAELKAQVVDLAILGAQKVIGKTLDSNTNRAIVRDFIDEVGKVS